LISSARFTACGRGVVKQALQHSQVYAATHLRVGPGQIPYWAGAQSNDPFASDDPLAVSRQRCHRLGFSSQFGVESHSVEDLGGECGSSIQCVVRRSIRIILVRNGLVLRARYPGGPLHSDAPGATSTCLRRLSELHRENLGKYPIVQALLDRAVSSARSTNAVPVYPGAFDRSLVAQRVQVEAHGGDVQPDARRDLDGVNRLVVFAHYLKHAFTLPIARQAISSPSAGLGVCFLVHLSLTFSYI
jgi:hypothetical protein